MEIKYLDIHSHLGFDDYGPDQTEVIKRMKENGIGTIAVGADLVTSIEAVKVATENENVWACIGQHPTHNIMDDDTKIHHGESFEVTHGLLGLTPHSESVVGFNEIEFEKLVKNPKVVAVGECGLEYYKLEGNIEEIKKKQKEDFIKQINLALKYDKPLMLHIRDGEKRGEAYEDVYNILKDYKEKIKGNVHFFAGGLEWAKKFIELGFTISFTGLITYVHDFDKIIKNVPLESLQAETDAPYVAPVPHRGERNEPSYVISVYQKITEILGEDPEVVRLQLIQNAKRVFGV
jgi:TatD DNase family protein